MWVQKCIKNNFVIFCILPLAINLVLDCEQSLFSQSSLSLAGRERANWPRGKLERGGQSLFSQSSLSLAGRERANWPRGKPAFARFARFSRAFFARVTILRDILYWQIKCVCAVLPVNFTPPTPRGATLRIFGWGCAAGTLEPLAYTRANSEFSWILLPYTRLNSPNLAKNHHIDGGQVLWKLK